jgi:hypothetical protein
MKNSIFGSLKQKPKFMELIKENSKSVLEQWVNQFSDELYSWAFLNFLQRNCRGSGTRHFSGCIS